MVAYTDITVGHYLYLITYITQFGATDLNNE